MNAYFNNEFGLFMGANRNINDCTVGLFGVPYDGTTLKRENVIKKIAVKRIAKENNKFLSLYMGHNINEITEEDLILDQKIIKKHN